MFSRKTDKDKRRARIGKTPKAKGVALVLQRIIKSTMTDL